jgi:Ca2+-transporting ATPase
MALIGPKILWQTLSQEEIKAALDADFKNGLSDKTVNSRREKYGRNVLKKPKKISFLGRIFKQIRNPLESILLIAGVVTFFLGEYIDTTVIFIAVGINVLIGLIQGERASKAFDKLNSSQQREATVIRNGRKFILPTEDLVKGDIVILEAGTYVPADIRILKAKNFSVNEAALTGEWVDVPKTIEEIPREKPLSEQFNMTWMGTLVSSGEATGIVVEIGSRTQFGEISESLIMKEENTTPVQKNIRKIARFLAAFIVLIILIIFALGIFRGEPISEMLLLAVAVAVSVIPEGLPAAVTVVLVLGMERILKKGGLVKNLLAAETLGGTTVILTDKTGTLTEGKMRLEALYTLSSVLNTEKREEDEKNLLKMAVLSSDAFVEEDKEGDEMIVRGRPIEKAIMVAGLEAGLSPIELEKTDKRIDLLPFDSENRFSVSLNNFGESGYKRLYFSGSPEGLLSKSQFVYKNGKAIKLTKEMRGQFARIQERRSREGMRFIGLAYEESNIKKIVKEKVLGKDNSNNLVYAGLISFNDPVRQDVPESINLAKEAGARVIMITGDNKDTAHKIAQEVGIIKDRARIIEGNDMERMNDKDLLEALMRVKVFARVLPSQKLRISRVLKKAGEIVAMTGDGINDAPALKGAHIGLAVGSGTEVAKDAADIILLNNSFSIIVSAIEEGRRIMDNLKKIISFLFSTSFEEIFVIAGALLFALPLPVLPAQILWINIVEEGVMNFAFAFEPKEKDIMKRDPKSNSAQNILTATLRKLILTVGITSGLFAIFIYVILLKMGMPIEKIRTMIFAILALDPIFFSLSFKSLRTPVWKINLFSNRYLLVSMTISFLLLISALTFGPLQKLLSVVPLSRGEFGFLFIVGILNLFLIEIAKYFVFRRKKLDSIEQ